LTALTSRREAETGALKIRKACASRPPCAPDKWMERSPCAGRSGVCVRGQNGRFVVPRRYVRAQLLTASGGARAPCKPVASILGAGVPCREGNSSAVASISRFPLVRAHTNFAPPGMSNERNTLDRDCFTSHAPAVFSIPFLCTRPRSSMYFVFDTDPEHHHLRVLGVRHALFTLTRRRGNRWPVPTAAQIAASQRSCPVLSRPCCIPEYNSRIIVRTDNPIPAVLYGTAAAAAKPPAHAAFQLIED
jgi:hypothetical protein